MSQSTSNPSTLQAELAAAGMTLTGQWADFHAVAPFTPKILLHGPAGTGKTSCAYYGVNGAHLAPEDVEVIECHDELMVAEALGHFIRVGDRTVWFDGPVARAARLGKVLLIDEIDHAGGALLTALRSWLNDPRIVKFTLPAPALATATQDELRAMIGSQNITETIKPAAGFRVIAAMNGEPEDLDIPLVDRFVVKRITDLHPAALAKLPEWLRDFAADAAQGPDHERISLRAWLTLTQYLLPNVPEDLAFRTVFGERADDIRAALAARIGGPIPGTISGQVPSIPAIEVPAMAPAPAPAQTFREAGLNPAPVSVAATPDFPPVTSLSDARTLNYPVAFRGKSGKAGRPAAPDCPHCGQPGKGNTRAMNPVPGGNLDCPSCSGIIFPAGTFTVRYKNPDQNAGKNSKWLPVPGY